MSIVNKEAEINTCPPSLACRGAEDTLVNAIACISELRLIPRISDETLERLDKARTDLAWTAGYMSAMARMLEKE